MRPLTPRHVMTMCGLLLFVLFVVVVISRMGAYPDLNSQHRDDALPME